MLLSNPEVVHLLNNELIPCWESVRPVPKVTIDFGDGKVLKRTLQGNTVIYLCLPDGRVIDAFPGIYTPEDFLSEMSKAIGLLREHQTKVGAQQVRDWHKTQVSLKIQSEKMRTTYSKALVESPLLKALGLDRRLAKNLPEEVNYNQLMSGMDLKATFEAVSKRLEDISKKPATVEQLRQTYSSYPKDEQLSPEMLGKMAINIDSKNNMAIVRPAVHLLFASYEELPSPAECRDVIYKQILHVPIDDPYLGLIDALVPGSPAR